MNVVTFFYVPKNALTVGNKPGTKVFIKCKNNSEELIGLRSLISGYDGTWSEGERKNVLLVMKEQLK